MDGFKRSTSSRIRSSSAVNHRRTQRSTTLNRKFVKRPAKRQEAQAAEKQQEQQLQQRAQVMRKSQIRAQGQLQQGRRVNGQKMLMRQQAVKLRPLEAQKQQDRAEETQDVPVQKHRIVSSAKMRISRRKQLRVKMQKQELQPQLSAQERKDRAIQQALRKVSMMSDEGDEGRATVQFGEVTQKKIGFFKGKKLAFAGVMAVISLGLLGYLVHLNLPDISVRIAAAQAGIENAYPSYVPTNYRLDGLVREENGKITMAFKNGEGQHFTLREEKSSWDSAAVLANYVKKEWGENYSVAKGQGLTIYVSESRAAWVNGGVFYTIIDEGGSLSASDLHDIAVSL